MAKEKENAEITAEVKPTIQIPVDQLQQILENQKEQAELIANLTAAANQNKLAEIVSSKRPKELPRVFLKVFRNKVVTSWKTATSRYLYGTGSQSPIGEVLQSVYVFADGTESGPIDQTEFTREDTRLWCRLQEGLRAIQDPEMKQWTLIAEELETADESLRNSFQMPKGSISVDRNFVNP